MIKAYLRPVTAMLCLTALTCWLFVKSRQDHHQQYDQLCQLLNVISRVDAEINAEVLKLKSHLHRNYDRLAMLEKYLDNSRRQVENYREFAIGQEGFDDPLTQPLARKLQLITEFKALHAVLENSVAIFGRNCEKLTEHLQEGVVQPEALGPLLKLEKAGNDLVLHADPRSIEALEGSIERLKSIPMVAESAAYRTRRVLVAHAKKLLEAKPTMDQLLEELDHLSVTDRLQVLQDIAARTFARTRREAAVYHLLLLAATFWLIAYCGYSIFSIGRYVNAIRNSNDKLEDRVKVRTRELESKTEVLRSNGRFLSSVLDAMDARICILDSAGTVNATNAAWGNDRTDSDFIRLGENYLQAFKEDRRTVFGSHSVVEAIERLKRDDTNSVVVEFGTNSTTNCQWIQARVSKMTPKGPDKFLGFVVALLDITDRRQLEQQLQQAQKLESVGQLAAGIAHEINTPMQYVGDNVQFVQGSLHQLEAILQLLASLDRPDETSSPVTLDAIRQSIGKVNLTRLIDQMPKAIDDAQQGIDNVARIIVAMKEFSHPGTALPTALDINRVLESTVVVSKCEWKYVAEVELSLDPQTPSIAGFANELQQVFLNLVVNAAHAVEARGRADEEFQGKIRVTSSYQNDRCLVTIEDNGCGIPHNIRNRVYDPFFTTKEVGKGTGQGLAIAHQVIVNKHHGKLWLESEEGVGTTFFVELPIDTSLVMLP